jgi:hypothetical protein
MIELKSPQVQSWTTNICVAEKYAELHGKKGVVVSAILNPRDIIIDSRFIEIQQLRKHATRWTLDPNSVLFIPHQNEILTKPGNYTCRIEKLIFNADGGALHFDVFPNESLRSDLIEGWESYSE